VDITAACFFYVLNENVTGYWRMSGTFSWSMFGFFKHALITKNLSFIPQKPETILSLKKYELMKRITTSLLYVLLIFYWI